jgi:hypothetical protein
VEELVAWGLEVGDARRELAGVVPIIRTELLETGQEAREVVGMSRMDDVEVEGMERDRVEDRADATYQDKINFMAEKRV